MRGVHYYGMLTGQGGVAMDVNVANHCAVCGKEIEPEKTYCAYCTGHQDPCPICNRVICECEVLGGGD